VFSKEDPPHTYYLWLFRWLVLSREDPHTYSPWLFRRLIVFDTFIVITTLYITTLYITTLYSTTLIITTTSVQDNHWPGDPHLANYQINESDVRPSDQYTLSSPQNTMSSVPPDVTLHAQDYQGSREYLASSNYTSSDFATTSNDYSSLYTGSRDYQSSTVQSSNVQTRLPW
jgi:hypothetical protein